MATRVISERLLVRAARRHQRTTGCAEDELVRLCERRDHPASEAVEAADQSRPVSGTSSSPVV